MNIAEFREYVAKNNAQIESLTSELEQEKQKSKELKKAYKQALLDGENVEPIEFEESQLTIAKIERRLALTKEVKKETERKKALETVESVLPILEAMKKENQVAEEKALVLITELNQLATDTEKRVESLKSDIVPYERLLDRYDIDHTETKEIGLFQVGGVVRKDSPLFQESKKALRKGFSA